MTTPVPRHVVVVGAGFAGLHAFQRLVKAGFEVTLIDRNPYTAFQPFLYQVATGGLNPGDVTVPLRRIVARAGSRAKFRRSRVTAIDTQRKLLHVSRGEPIAYDRLVVTAGVGANFFGIPGAAEHALTIYTRGEALHVRDVLFSSLESLTTRPVTERSFTILVVGGGATGVEMAGTLAELKSEALAVLYPELDPETFHVVLVEMGPSLLGPFDEKLRDYTLAELRKRGVDVRLQTAVKAVRRDSVDLSDGSKLAVNAVVWASGVGAHDEVNGWGLPQGRGGRILIDEYLRVRDLADVWGGGDAVLNPDDPQPQLAQPAIQMGEHIARQLIAERDGGELQPFRYRDKGTMATIGRNAAITQLPFPRLRISGFVAWLLWVVVHLRALLGGRNRIQAMVSLGFRYLSWPRSAAGIVGDITEVSADQPRS